MNVFSAPHFHDEAEARIFLEKLRWPNGPVCNHCGEAQRRYLTKREGRFRCGNPECRKDYSVTTGTVMERSHIPLTKWLMAFYLMCSSKKGISAHQLYRSLGIGSYQSAWFMAHRIREAMRAGGLVSPMGGEGEHKYTVLWRKRHRGRAVIAAARCWLLILMALFNNIAPSLGIPMEIEHSPGVPNNISKSIPGGGDFIAFNGGASRAVSEIDREEQSSEAERAQGKLPFIPEDSISRRLRHLPLFAQISFFVIVGALTVWIPPIGLAFFLFPRGPRQQINRPERRKIGAALLVISAFGYAALLVALFF